MTAILSSLALITIMLILLTHVTVMLVRILCSVAAGRDKVSGPCPVIVVHVFQRCLPPFLNVEYSFDKTCFHEDQLDISDICPSKPGVNNMVFCQYIDNFKTTTRDHDFGMESRMSKECNCPYTFPNQVVKSPYKFSLYRKVLSCSRV